MSAPRVRDLAALRRFARCLLRQPGVDQHFGWQADTGFLGVYTDTDFACCAATRKSTSGGCVMFVEESGREVVQTYEFIAAFDGGQMQSKASCNR